MSYTVTNFPTKKALKEAVKSGQPVRMEVPMLGGVRSGRDWVEGPHYPQPHRWYAEVWVKDGLVKQVVS